jgi:phospholipid/cholesterol/gamma-HCH transport system permease protein
MTTTDIALPVALEPAAELIDGSGRAVLRLTGAWTMRHARTAEKVAQNIAGRLKADESIDLSGVSSMDTLGALLIHGLLPVAQEKPNFIGASDEHKQLIKAVFKAHHPAPPLGRSSVLMTFLAEIGETLVLAGRDFIAGVAFMGGVVAAAGRLLLHPSRFRFAAVVNQIEHIALRGAPIILLISALVGAIVAQQTVYQLQTFGTTAFVADLLGILVLRELAILLAAIMVAGRSGSAFTAEIGSMKMREEIDAMRTIGLDPMEVLVVPRIIGLMISLPILAFLAGLAGLVGGGFVAVTYGGVGFEVFMQRLQASIGMNTFLVGLIKAPFMALVIGLIACLEGLKVEGSAESLGRHTTAAVVKAIFVVIIVDGLFAMFFAAIKF